MAEPSQQPAGTNTPGQVHKVTRSALPLHCPTDNMPLWDSHPRVFLPIEATGKARCPYCGNEYELVD